MSRIGENISKKRIEKKLSAKQLAKKLGVNEKFILEVESGRKVINEGLISRISKVLDTDLNDISMNYDVEEEKSEKIKPNKIEKRDINESFKEAFNLVFKEVNIYDYCLNEVKGTRKLPIENNKIEGFPVDKVFYIEIEKDDMLGFRMAKGDLALCHKVGEAKNDSICLIEVGEKRAIRQIKYIDSNNILLISNKNSINTENINKNQMKIIGKLERLEIKL
ncbi:MAG: multiprotein-bridging factor 1 family protein [Clostridiaceae bacterium]